MCVFSCSFSRWTFKLCFRHQFIYFEAITTMLCDAQWKTTHEICLLPSESLMHASDLLWPTHSGECNKRAQINNKILAYNEMNEEFMALWQIERERKNYRRTKACADFLLALVCPYNQNLFECFYFKEFVCFNFTIDHKVFSMVAWTVRNNAKKSHAGFLVL